MARRCRFEPCWAAVTTIVRARARIGVSERVESGHRKARWASEGGRFLGG